MAELTSGANAPAAPMLSVTGLRKSYGGKEVVRGISFSVRPGECYGLLGPNGAGKTTTLKLCLGLNHPDSGTITLCGHPVPEHSREARLRVGVVPQMDNLDPDFTVTENLLIGLIFTAVSIVRSYALRRGFEALRVRQSARAASTISQ